jgi:hypothetical protein
MIPQPKDPDISVIGSSCTWMDIELESLTVKVELYSLSEDGLNDKFTIESMDNSSRGVFLTLREILKQSEILRTNLSQNGRIWVHQQCL